MIIFVCNKIIESHCILKQNFIKSIVDVFKENFSMNNPVKLFTIALISFLPGKLHSSEDFSSKDSITLSSNDEQHSLCKKRANLDEIVPPNKTIKILGSNKNGNISYDLDSFVFKNIDKWKDVDVQTEITRLSKFVLVSKKDSQIALPINDFVMRLKVKKERVSIRLFDENFVNNCMNNTKKKSYSKQSEFALFLKILLFKNSIADNSISYKCNNQNVISSIKNKEKIIEKLNNILNGKIATFQETLKSVVDIANNQTIPQCSLAKEQIKRLISVLTHCKLLKNIRCDLASNTSTIKLNFNNDDPDIIEQVPFYNNLGTVLTDKFAKYLSEYTKTKTEDNDNLKNEDTVTFGNKLVMVDEFDKILKKVVESSPSYANRVAALIENIKNIDSK